MQRVTITIDDDLLAEIDAAAKARGYQNRSEIIRDLVRSALQQQEHNSESGQYLGALVYVYDHDSRKLSKRLGNNFHSHHDLSLGTLHIRLDDDNCLELSALKGRSPDLQHFADHIIAERGVKYGRMVMIPMPSDNRRKKNDQRRGARHAVPHRHTPVT